MAARLSADLGLHLDVSEQTRQGLLDSRDIYIRQTAYQGVFIHERYAVQSFGSNHSLTRCKACGHCTLGDQEGWDQLTFPAWSLHKPRPGKGYGQPMGTT
jgi:hypothetical protein